MNIPYSEADITDAKKAARYAIAKYATGSCVASAVPIPGTDIVADLYCTINMLESICEIFGLSPEQIEKLDPKLKAIITDAIITAGNAMVGKVITKQAVIVLFKSMGKRLTVKQAAKYIPIIGQVTSVAITASLMWAIGEKQIRDCAQIAKAVGVRIA